MTIYGHFIILDIMNRRILFFALMSCICCTNLAQTPSTGTLFQRVEGQPPKPDTRYEWISNSTANPDILSPDRSPDGNWWLFIRGGDGKYGHLGVYTQKAATFNPLGPWDYYKGNPVIPCGMRGDYDVLTVIDPAPILGPDGKVYLYYKGYDSSHVPYILLATSKDGYKYNPIRQPWQENAGVADVVKGDDGKYYLFVSRRVYVFSDLMPGAPNEIFYDILAKGDGPDHFDSYSINGEKVCRLPGIKKWFMIYQGSSTHDDFPDRFHVALSDDLIHWTKVKNDQPLFTRGEAGTWDQGAIWAPEIFEYNGTIYMYYEGWGCKGTVPNRDIQYFRQGHSEIGIATCSREDFLRWCGLSDK